MKNFLLLSGWLSVLIIASCKDDKPGTETVYLENDGYVSGSGKQFQGGLVTDDEAAVALGPVDKTFQVTGVYFFFGGSSAVSREVVLKIYIDNGAITPGTLLFTSTHFITSSNDIWQEIDLSGESIILDGGGSIRVSVQMTQSGFPSIARDDDGTISSSKNYIKTGGSWITSSSLGQTGDWIIRAVVEKYN